MDFRHSMGKKGTAEPNTTAGIELDKFKRRLIRAVARLLLIEKKTEGEVWATLKKETGCDCRTLWMRMRALTLKKLHRLFVANDNVKDIPKVARMSFTDWLLFDLVLVHQNVDVIGQDNPTQNPKHDPKPLVDLFELVKEFRIEGRRCESLAGAWSAATLKYNGQGHQCSPMLLQLRWYQLKEVTRDKFYNFWYAYRGTAKRLTLAEPHMPTCLQAAIATEYKDIVTRPFLEWEEMIEKRMVTLPDEFERKMMDKSIHRRPSANRSDDAPDLVVIEPHIETIDLGVESDKEDETNDVAEKTQDAPEIPIRIKEEPIDIEMDIEETRVEEPPKKSIYDVVLESTAIEHEKIDSMDETELPITDDVLEVEENVIKETIESTLKTQELVLPQITSVFGNVSDTSVLTDNNTLENVDDTPVIAHIDDTLIIDHENETPSLAKDDDTVIRDSVDNTLVPPLVERDHVDNTTEVVSLDNTNVVNKDASNVNIDIGGNDILVDKSNTKLSISDALSPQTSHTEITDINQDAEIDHNDSETVTSPDSPKDTTEENRELNAEDTSRSENTQSEAIDDEPDNEECVFIEPFKASNSNEDAVMAEDIVDNRPDEDIKPDITSYSFGELSNDINFVDDGIELVDDGIAYHDEDNHDEINGGDVPKIDPKLLMCPIIYTMKLDDMGMFHATPFEHIEGKELLDAILSKSKPIKILPEEDSTEKDLSETDDSEGEVTDNQRVKISSYMLQKPRSRSYNPIQLCKNPDFNTRLKRLTVGFFSSPRNRGLIKSCKPLTIDLSKTFESKLISGTLYLKPSDDDVKPDIIDDTESRQNVTVLPSAMPAQSLIDNSKIGDIIPLLPSSEVSYKPPDEFSSTCERNKVINLPDISEIRRINQRLLTAEVTPIQVQNSRIQVPISIVASTPTVTAQSVGVAPADVRGPPSIVDVTKDSPAKKNTECNSFTDNSVQAFATHKSGRRHLQDNLFCTGYNGRGRKKITHTVSWKPRQIRPAIPWLTKNQETAPLPSKIDDTLLTLDTLNKMLYLLTNETEEPKPKPVKKKKGISSQQSAAKKQTAQSKPANKEVQSVSETQDNQTESTAKCAKPKFNIKSAVNYHQKKQKQNESKTVSSVDVACADLTESDTEQSENSKDQQTDDQQNEDKYCCWARQRMLQISFSRKHIPPHPCLFSSCTCCCRSLLFQFIIDDHKKKAAKIQDETTSPDVDLCQKDASDNPDNVAADGEGSVELPDHVSQEETVQVEGSKDPTPLSLAEEPVLDVEAVQDTATTAATENEPIDIDALESQDGVPTVGGEVNVSTTSFILPERKMPPLSTIRNIPIDISRHKSGPRITTIDKRKRKPKISQPHAASQIRANHTPTPTIRKVLAQKKAAVGNTLGINIPPLRKYKPFSPPKQFKEKMIFLNSKHISDNSPENPIYLGKNKILLTTVKFPPNLRKFEEARQALKSSLKIPNGVQLICLPNGLISYTIDTNVEVNATDMASMPVIIAKLQAEINKRNPVTELPKPSVVENEIVNLIDDDDDDPPKDNENKNVESSSEVEVPTIQVAETESATQENLDNSNNENTIDNTTETNLEETNVNINAIPIQAVQDLSETEALSAENDQSVPSSINAVPIQAVQDLSETEALSAENDQSVPSSTDVREESISEPTTKNKSKNILSDLMEMSGIFEEDATPEETLPAEAIEQQIVMANTSDSVEQQEVVLANATESIEDRPAVAPTMIAPQQAQSIRQVCVVASNKVSCQSNMPPVIKSPLGELSPITSLYELKYACLNNGIFFKLDFETGYLVPINVCMKQTPKVTPKPIDTQSVIDLTEDDNDKVEPTSTFTLTNKPPDQRSLLKVNNPPNEVSTSTISEPVIACTSSSPVKPVKLFRAVKPPMLFRRKSHFIPIALEASNNVTDMNETIDHKLKRKQFIRTVDLIDKELNTAMAKQPSPKLYYRRKRKIDGVTTNNDNSEDSAKKTETTSPELPKNQTESNIGSDDSSDEEPLSNLAKRKRENEIRVNEQSEGQTEKPNDVQPDNQSVEQSDRQNEVDLQTVDSEDVDMDDNAPAESESVYEIMLEKSLAEEAEEEEQCILGV